MTYPNWNKIREIAENAGGHCPDAIAPATCFDLILWNESNGELWKETHIASDYDNFWNFHTDVHVAGIAWNDHLTADEIISQIASTTCPHMTLDPQTPANCPYSETGMPMCDIPPLCRHADKIKRDIIFGRVETT